MDGEAESVTVYREPGRFAGWPANFGLWAWGDELVSVFTAGWLGPTGPGLHAVDGGRGFETVQVRSRDGGRTWEREPFTGAAVSPHGLSVDEHLPGSMRTDAILDRDAFERRFVPVPDGLDLAADDVVLLAGRTGLHAGATSWLYASDDRCRTWQGPFPLPDFGQPGIAARTDAVRLGPGDLLLLLTAAKANGREGRVFAARTVDGGRTFRRLGWLGPEPAGYAIMPATVRLPGGRLLTAVRRSEPRGSGPAHTWIELFTSTDAGESWRPAGRPVPDAGRGNPATLTATPPAPGAPGARETASAPRLALCYGYRAEPFGIRARTSADGGATWGPEAVLRDDGGCADLGYPRTVVRGDGACVTVYYLNDAVDSERYIAATVWRP